MKRIAARLVAALMVIAVFISLIPVNTFAWKNLTHVNSADLILLELQRSAAWNGGRAGIGVNLPYGSTNVYSYEIPSEYQEALFEYPDAFRAGSMGPDFYPDILTGQGYIHPYDADKKIGSGEWITLLCNSVNMLPKDSPERKKALAFTLGFMLHFCGDMFGHDFINMFAGGTYPLLSEVNYVDGTDQNLNIILSHMSEETYMDSLVNWDFYNQLGYLNIAAPVQFVADTLVFNGNVNNGPATIFGKYGSVPVQYEYLINLRMELFEKAEKWRPSIDPAYTTAVKYLDAWIKDLDDATYALVGCFDNMARRMVTEKNPSTTGIVTEELKAWVDSYGKYITPAPDIMIDGITFPKDILNMITSAIGLDEFVQDIEEWMLEQVESLALSALGFTGLDKVIDEYKDRMSNPQVQLDHEDNPFRQDTDNFAEFKIYMDRYALEQQMLSGVSMFDLIFGSDRGALDNALDSDLEAFYNTLVMFKLILMGPDNFKSFISKFAGVDQDSYQKNPANLVATTLELKMKTGNSGHGGTDDNIYALILRKKGNGYEVIRNKLLDISNHNDFEAGKTDTYLVELGQPVRLDEIEILIEQESTGTAASAWNFAGVEITPYHAGIKLMDPIGFVGNSEMDSGKSVDLNFHEELMMRTRNIEKWTVNEVELYIKVKANDYVGEDCGTYDDVYLDAYNGSSRKKSSLLDNEGTDFKNGKEYTYYVPLGREGIPLDKLNLKLRLDGGDALKMDNVYVRLYHGEVRLTDWILIGENKKLENSTWDFSLQGKLSGHLKSFTPITLSFETNLDDGLLSYQKSLDDSGQWVSDASILWGNKKVRSEVFFRIFKGFEPEAEYKGKSEIGYGDSFDLEIVLSGVWNGVSRERRESIPGSAKMPPVNGGISVDFIDANGVSAGGFQEGITNGRIIKKAYKNSGLKPGVYGMTIRYNADRSNQQYADTFVTIPNVLTVTERTPVSHKVTFKVANGSWDDGKPDDIVVTVKGYEGDTLTLADVTIPTAGQKPSDNSYKPGSWDSEPKASTVIGDDTVFTYTYAKKAEISHKVTFKVVNGSWDDGKPDDIVVTVKGYEGDTLTLEGVTIPTAGQKPSDNSYKPGSWDSEPKATTVIEEDTVFTYTYSPKDRHTVTFKTGGGTAIPSVTVIDGEPVAVPQDPERKSYFFAGWFADEALTKPFDFSAGITTDTVVYAAWEEVIYTATGDSTFTEGAPRDLVITVKRSHADETCFSHFSEVTIDGRTLTNGTDYTAAPGSTVITLKAGTLKDLTAGEHEVRVIFDDGAAGLTVTVSASTATPDTGDTAPVVICTSLLAGLLSLAFAVLSKRRRRDE